MSRDRDGAEDPLRKKMDDTLADGDMRRFKGILGGKDIHDKNPKSKKGNARTYQAQQERPKAGGFLGRLLGR